MLQGTVNVLLYTVKTNKIHKFQNKFKNLRFESKQKTQANLKSRFPEHYTVKLTIIEITSSLEDF